uniref:Uncharacterized protein n=1 Tax=Anguilla anguilla TaxID=7936 RepID=A0A0E9W1F6_ANGAN
MGEVLGVTPVHMFKKVSRQE